MKLIVEGRRAVRVHRLAVLWEATSQPMHGRTRVQALVGTAVTQDIMPSTVLILMRPIPKAPKILGMAVRIRAKRRAVESAPVQMNKARHGMHLH